VGGIGREAKVTGTMEENKFIKFDFPIFWTALALWFIGIFMVYSATYTAETGPLAGLYKQQIMWVVMAICIIITLTSLPGRFFFSFAYILFGLSIMLLLLALAKGSSAKGAERWIAIGGFKLQPSEFAKIGLLLALARYLSDHDLSLEKISTFIMPAVLIGIPFLLVLKQPDLGTALVSGAMAIPLFYWAGLTLIEVLFLVSPIISLGLSAVPLIMSYANGKEIGFAGAIPWGVFFLLLILALYLARPSFFILVGVILANLFTATIFTIVWRVMKDYQKMRIISFVDPEKDASGAGYQVIQSKVAIGSGFLFGKGYLHGTQTTLSFLPEQQTDFIFSVLGEQFGLFGCTLVICLFFFLVARGFYLTQSVRNRFNNLLIVGSTSIVAIHVFFNASMALGMMPVVGIPLPFLSYGGSFTLTLAVLLGLIFNAKKSD